jgi:2'-5' RNA ligase
MGQERIKNLKFPINFSLNLLAHFSFYIFCYNRRMRRRVFVAINLPERVKKELVGFQKEWSQLPVRWVKDRNLHLTLAFLGYLTDEELVEVCQAVKGVALKHSPFLINLIKIDYGAKKKEIPRLVWAEGKKSQELALLKEDLDKSLLESIGLSPERRDFLAHITLGRVRAWDWKKIEPEERPDISKGVSLEFEVRSIEVMESQLKKGGAEYLVLESGKFKKI